MNKVDAEQLREYDWRVNSDMTATIAPRQLLVVLTDLLKMQPHTAPGAGSIAAHNGLQCVLRHAQPTDSHLFLRQFDLIGELAARLEVAAGITNFDLLSQLVVQCRWLERSIQHPIRLDAHRVVRKCTELSNNLTARS